MNCKHLFYFWNVARHGSVSRAAEQLHLTPQTISGQISTLERELGVSLFRRRGRQLELTPQGELAFTHSDEIFRHMKELEGLLRGQGEDGALSFHVGISDMVPKSIAYRLLAPALQIDETVRLRCQENKLDQLFSELAIHRIDLVIADRPLPTGLGVKGYSHLLGKSDMAFFASKKLSGLSSHRFPQCLHTAPMLLPGPENELRVGLEQWFEKHRIHPHIVGEFDDSALMKAFGQEGAGVFPAPAVIADEIKRQYNVRMLGIASGLSVGYYAISAERRLRHPAIVAISKAAHHHLFPTARAVS